MEDRELLEPIAEKILREFAEERRLGRTIGATDAQVHAFSLAISAKRIADALEKLTKCVGGVNDKVTHEFATFTRPGNLA